MTVAPSRTRSRPAAKPAPRRTRPTRSNEPSGPHVRLGILWAVGSAAALLAGPWWTAVWAAGHAGVAGLSLDRAVVAGRSGRARGGRGRAGWSPRAVTASAGGVAATLGAGWGPLPGLAALVVLSVLVTLARPGRGRPRGGAGLALALAPTTTAAGLTATRSHGLAAALVLLAMVCVYDAGSFLIGTGADHAWEGPLAGVASVGSLALFVAGLLEPPFRAGIPWVLGVLAAVLAPAGVILVRRLTPKVGRPVPALTRLDSLVLLAPVWAALTAAGLTTR